MRFALIFAVLSCLYLLAVTRAQAYEPSYMPLDAKVLSRRIPQKMRAHTLNIGDSINIGKTRVEIPSDISTPLFVHGTDTSGKPWSYYGSTLIGTATVWSADLDRNGYEDLIVLMPTGGCGWAPTCHLLVLMFEKNGRPVPWLADGYFEVDKHGIKDFVDLQNDGHCQLIRQSFSEGYWITSFYEAASCRFHRMKTSGGTKLPLYTRFSVEDNHKAIVPRSSRHPFDADLSNDCSNPLRTDSTKYLDELEWSKTQLSKDPTLHFSDGSRTSPIGWYSTMSVVIDEPSGRRMASLSNDSAVYKLLSEICHRRLPVSTSGTRGPRDHTPSSVEFIYAQSGSSINKQSSQAKSYDRLLSCRDELPDLAADQFHFVHVGSTHCDLF